MKSDATLNTAKNAVDLIARSREEEEEEEEEEKKTD